MLNLGINPLQSKNRSDKCWIKEEDSQNLCANILQGSNKMSVPLFFDTLYLGFLHMQMWNK